jgi:hypothetical protein
MKGTAAIVLIMLLLTQTFSKWMWVLEYELNKTYIANTLCINKAKPQLQCKGGCQLSKKLAEDEQGSSSVPAVEKSKYSPVFFKKDLETVSCPWQFVPKQETYYLESSYTSLHPEVFHPPAV